MPRDANGVFYFPPGTEAVPFTTANSGDVNARFDAVRDDLNGGPVSASRLTGTIADARLPATMLRTVTAGDGMTVTATSTSAIALSVASSVVRTGRKVIAGTGLTGGGDLGADRTLAFDTTWGDGRYSLRTRTLATGDGLQGGGDLTANRTLEVDSTVVRTSRTIYAGSGLTGAGNLSADRTITLGTPGSITATSTNSVSTNSHTHAISEVSIRDLISQGGAGLKGTYAFLTCTTVANVYAGQTKPGSELAYSNGAGRAGVSGEVNVRRPTGTWECMGYSTAYDGSRYNNASVGATDGNNATLWLRVI